MRVFDWLCRSLVVVLGIVLFLNADEIVGYRLLAASLPTTGDAAPNASASEALAMRTTADFLSSDAACRRAGPNTLVTSPVDDVIHPGMRLLVAHEYSLIAGSITVRVRDLGPIERIQALLSATKQTEILRQVQRSASDRFRRPYGGEAADRRLIRLAACGSAATTTP
jgi:hypothetical protein